MSARLAIIAICTFPLSMTAPAWSASAVPSGSDLYPSRPILLIAPGGAASDLDYRARQIAQKLTAALGQQVVIRPGTDRTDGDITATLR